MKIIELNIKEYEELVKKGLVEEENKIPEKLDWSKNDFTYPEGNLMNEETADMLMEIQDKINNIIDILNKGGNK